MNINLILSNKPGADGERSSTPYRFNQDEVLVGRDAAMDVQIPHPSISLMHLRLFRQGQALYVEDLGSTNGVHVDGVMLTKGCPLLLPQGAHIELGPYEMWLDSPQADRGVSPPEDTAVFARQMVRGMLGDPVGPCPGYLEVMIGSPRGERLEIPLLTGPLTIGRGVECNLALHDADASRRHLEVRREDGSIVVRDLGSKNGFQFNGVMVHDRCVLKHGDELKIGRTTLVYVQERDHPLVGDGDQQPIEQPSSPSIEHPSSLSVGDEAGASKLQGAKDGQGLVALSFGVGALVLSALAALVYLLS